MRCLEQPVGIATMGDVVISSTFVLCGSLLFVVILLAVLVWITYRREEERKRSETRRKHMMDFAVNTVNSVSQVSKSIYSLRGTMRGFHQSQQHPTQSKQHPTQPKQQFVLPRKMEVKVDDKSKKETSLPIIYRHPKGYEWYALLATPNSKCSHKQED